LRRLVIAAAIVGAIAATCGALSARTHGDHVRVTARVTQVEIDSGIGDVQVLGSNRTDVLVTHWFHFVVGRPSLGMRLTNTTLRLWSRCPRLDVACTVRTRALVPAGTRLVVRVKAGGVDVRRLYAPIDVHTHGGGVSILNSTGPVTARAGTGLVSLKRVRGTMTLRTDKGDVVLEDVQGRARINVKEGDIRGQCLTGGELDGFAESGIVSLSYSRTPNRVSVRTRVGGVAVWLPSGDYAIRAVADAGRVRVTRVAHDPGGSGLIDLRAGAGDVAVRGRSATVARSVSLRCGTEASRLLRYGARS
jgi:Putative adhesin